MTLFHALTYVIIGYCILGAVMVIVLIWDDRR